MIGEYPGLDTGGSATLWCLGAILALSCLYLLLNGTIANVIHAVHEHPERWFIDICFWTLPAEVFVAAVAFVHRGMPDLGGVCLGLGIAMSSVIALGEFAVGTEHEFVAERMILIAGFVSVLVVMQIFISRVYAEGGRELR